MKSFHKISHHIRVCTIKKYEGNRDFRVLKACVILCSPSYPIRWLLFEVKSEMLIADIELLLRR